MTIKKLLVSLLALSLVVSSSACSTSVDQVSTLITSQAVSAASNTPAVRATATTQSAVAATAAATAKSASATNTIATDEADTDSGAAATITLGDKITIAGTGAALSGNVVSITAGGDYVISGKLANGMVGINTDTTEAVKLTLNGVNITNASGPAIMVTNAKKLTIVLADNTTNYLTDGKNYANAEAKGALFSNDTLKIEGNGALVVTGNYKHGIASDDNLVIESGTITLSAVVDGIHANNNITVDGGTIKIIKANDGLQSEGDFVINGGAFTVAASEDGIVGIGNVTINGGTINITSAVEGIESKASLIVNDGLINIATSDDGLNATSNVTINGGYIYSVVSRGDALDSNGTLNINGGVTLAFGGTTPEGGSDTDNGAFSITGGTLIATGGSNSAPTANTSTQPSVLLGSVAANSILRIEQDGKEILTFKVSKAYQNMVFTSPNLVSGKSYTVLTGGSVSGGDDFHGLYTGATYSGGTQSLIFAISAMVTSAGGTAGGPGGGMPGGQPGRRP